MTKFVVSTMTNAVNYTIYADHVAPPLGSRTLPPPIPIKKKIYVNGGAGIPDSRSGFGERGKLDDGIPIWTPMGVVTKISDEDAELLMANHVFQRHLSGGWVKILDSDPANGNHDKMSRFVRNEMSQRDSFSQLRKGDVDDRIKIVTHPDQDQRRI